MSDFVVRSCSDADWEAALRQLRAQPYPQPRPFFYGRVHARLVAGAAAPAHPLPAWLRRPAYAALLGALVLGLSGDCVAPRPATGDAEPANRSQGEQLR